MAGHRRRTSRVAHNTTSIRHGEETMLKATILFAVGLCANVLIGLPAMAQAPADVTLTRIDCGTGATPTDVGQRFTDTFAYKDLKLTFTFSCYLIKHGTDYMVWDTGFAPGTSPNAPKVGIVDRLKELKDRKSTRLNSSHSQISYAVFCLK